MRKLVSYSLIFLYFPLAARAYDVDQQAQEILSHPLPVLSEEQIQQTRSWVLYKDEDVIVINKPAGISVNHSDEHNLGIYDRVSALQFDAPVAPIYAHRLDKPTTGTLVLARNLEAYKTLKTYFAEHKIQKTYWALLTCAPTPASGTVDKRLIIEQKHDHGGEYSHVEVTDDDSKGISAVTHYRVLQSSASGVTWVELTLETGRTHQLRVHMQSLGCPIVGDREYGKELSKEAKALGVKDVLQLHARHIVIPPLKDNGKPIDVTAPLPESMASNFKVLGWMSLSKIN